MSSLDLNQRSLLNTPPLGRNWTYPGWTECSNAVNTTLHPYLAFLSALVLLTTVWVLSVAFLGLGSPLKDFPGPPAWPVLGSYLSLYNKRPETIYQAWAQRYGSVFRVQIGSTPALIVNSGEAAKDLSLIHI